MKSYIKKGGSINRNPEKNLRKLELRNESDREIMDGELVCGDTYFKVSLFRLKKSSSDDFLVSAISNNCDKTIWKLREGNPKIRSLLFMVKSINEYAIILEEERGKLVKVIPIADLLDRKRNLKDIIVIKKLVAEELKMIPILSKKEDLFLINQYKAEEDKKKEEAKKEKMLKEAEEKIRGPIRARREIWAIDRLKGLRVKGFSVTKEEWKFLLPPDTAIIVEKYLPGQKMKAEETFFVTRDKEGNLIKGSPKPVFPETFLSLNEIIADSRKDKKKQFKLMRFQRFELSKIRHFAPKVAVRQW